MEVYLAHCSGGLEVKEPGTGIWQGSLCCVRNNMADGQVSLQETVRRN
jgi:hypothetical protein